MLDLGSDPNIKDSNGWSALHYACQLGDFNSVEILINNGASIDSYSNNKRIPLHLAAYKGFPNIVEHLLKNGSDPNYQDELGCTPLHLASKKGHVKCIEFLLNYGAELYSLDIRSWNILHYASFHGHKKAVRFIAKYDADYDILQKMKNSQNKYPIEIVRDPSVKPYFYTLWHAAREGNLDLTKNLLNEGEDINEQSKFELNTPLHLAVLNNHYLEVRLLIENNCIPDMKNKDGIEPYHYAFAMNGPIKNISDISEDLERDTMDLREVVRSMVDRDDGVIDSMVCTKNRKLRVWTALDFNVKIIKLLESVMEEIIKEKENYFTWTFCLLFSLIFCSSSFPFSFSFSFIISSRTDSNNLIILILKSSAVLTLKFQFLTQTIESITPSILLTIVLTISLKSMVSLSKSSDISNMF